MAPIDLETHGSDIDGTVALKEGWGRSERGWDGRTGELILCTSLLFLHTAAKCSYEGSPGTMIGAIVEAEQFLDSEGFGFLRRR